MATEAIFRQVRRPPPRIYRGLPFCLLDQRWNRWGRGRRRGLTLLEEGGDTHAHTGGGELNLLLLAASAPVREYIGSALCL